MNVSSSGAFGATLVVALGALLATNSVCAAPQERTFYTNPVGICQAALPAYEGAIRKRPLAVQNEGTTSAFVTCSFTSQGQSITQVNVFVASIDNVAHQVSCTGVTGANDDFGGNQFVAKQVLVPASGSKVALVWNGTDFDDGIPGPPTNLFPSPMFSISCNLLPGTGINDSRVTFAEDIGA